MSLGSIRERDTIVFLWLALLLWMKENMHPNHAQTSKLIFSGLNTKNKIQKHLQDVNNILADKLFDGD
jgi:hypothetical protein